MAYRATSITDSGTESPLAGGFGGGFGGRGGAVGGGRRGGRREHGRRRSAVRRQRRRRRRQRAGASRSRWLTQKGLAHANALHTRSLPQVQPPRLFDRAGRSPRRHSGSRRIGLRRRLVEQRRRDPGGGDVPPRQAPGRPPQKALFTYAACMRGKGVKIPDPCPGANGRYAIPKIPRSSSPHPVSARRRRPAPPSSRGGRSAAAAPPVRSAKRGLPEVLRLHAGERRIVRPSEWRQGWIPAGQRPGSSERPRPRGPPRRRGRARDSGRGKARAGTETRRSRRLLQLDQPEGEGGAREVPEASAGRLHGRRSPVRASRALPPSGRSPPRRSADEQHLDHPLASQLPELCTASVAAWTSYSVRSSSTSGPSSAQ